MFEPTYKWIRSERTYWLQVGANKSNIMACIWPQPDGWAACFLPRRSTSKAYMLRPVGKKCYNTLNRAKRAIYAALREAEEGNTAKRRKQVRVRR